MPEIRPNSAEWLGLVREEIIDPARPIVDPHHHLWIRPNWMYVLEDFRADTGSGHNITKTVFIECREQYRQDGPEHLKPIGETEFVAKVAAVARNPPGPPIAGIVAHADLRSPLLDEVLDAQEAAAGGLLRGIRHAGARDPHPEQLSILGRGLEGQYASAEFRRGLARLGERGLTYDTWHYHHQNAAFRDMAAAVPETTLILDHFGTPLGVGRFAGQREEIFARWKDDIAAIAECPNVRAKLGGMAMPDNGFGWERRDRPPTSDEFVEAQSRYYHHAIACFGADRCMFESNFPVDRLSISYHVLWNAFKKMAAQYSPTEQEALFVGTATKTYRLDD